MGLELGPPISHPRGTKHPVKYSVSILSSCVTPGIFSGPAGRPLLIARLPPVLASTKQYVPLRCCPFCGLLTRLPVTAVTPTSTPLVPQPGAAPEIVVFVGLPALGKSSFYRRHFQPAGYVHVNQDTLKTRPKCIKVVDESISAGKSCVVGAASCSTCVPRPERLTRRVLTDNTNRDVATRKYYVDVAKKRGVAIRCALPMLWEACA